MPGCRRFQGRSMNERRSLIRPPSPVQRLQGLLALVISLLLLLGVPLALLSIWGAPIPAGLPEATTLWRELSSPTTALSC